MDLRCRKTSCEYNKDLTCVAPKIDITEKFICASFKEDKTKKEKDFSSLIFTQNPPKVADYRHIKHTCLTCKAKCLFNKNLNCIANGITVNAPNNTPKCITYMKP